MRSMKRRLEELEKWRAAVEMYLGYNPIKTMEIEENAATKIHVDYSRLQ